MRILHTEWSDGWGGQEQRILLELHELRKRNHTVFLAAPKRSQIFWRAKSQGFSVWDIDFKKSFDFFSALKLRGLIQKEGIQIVVTHSSVDSWVSALALIGLKRVGYVRMRHLSIAPQRRLNWVYYRPDRIVTTGKSIRELLMRELGLASEKVSSIPTGVDLSRFKKDLSGEKIRGELGLSPEVYVIVYAAVLRSWKRHDLAFRAFSLFRREGGDCHFLIAGAGPKEAELRALRENLQLSPFVTFLGHREDVEQVIAAADLCVLTSDKGEGVPQAVVQYLALARPVVATDVGGVAELVFPGKTGWLVPCNCPEALASSMLEAYKNRRSAKSLGLAGREMVEKFWSASEMVQKVETLYQQVINERGASH